MRSFCRLFLTAALFAGATAGALAQDPDPTPQASAPELETTPVPIGPETPLVQSPVPVQPEVTPAVSSELAATPELRNEPPAPQPTAPPPTVATPVWKPSKAKEKKPAEKAGKTAPAPLEKTPEIPAAAAPPDSTSGGDGASASGAATTSPSDPALNPPPIEPPPTAVEETAQTTSQETTREVRGTAIWLVILALGGLLVIGLVFGFRRRPGDLSILDRTAEPPPLRNPARRPRLGDAITHPRR